MSKVLVNDSSLSAIGDAIREKNGEETKYKLSEMPEAISAIEGGGEAIYPSFDGSIAYIDYYGIWDNYLEEIGDKIKFSNINDASSAFYKSELSSLPFEIDWDKENSINLNNAFSYTSYYPSLEGFQKISSLSNTFYYNASEEEIIFPNLIEINEDINYTFYYAHAKKVSFPKLAKIQETTGPNMLYAIFYYSNVESVDLSSLKEINYNNKQLSNPIFGSAFTNCNFLKEILISEDIQLDTSSLSSQEFLSNGFSSCYSLREIPKFFLKLPKLSTRTIQYSNIYSSLFYFCTSLNEIKNLEVKPVTITNNFFLNTFDYCYRVKDITFATNEDGSAQTANWKNQTINLSTYVGFTRLQTHILNYNSGITEDKKVTTLQDYERLKNDPDWFCNPGLREGYFSRYDHDSAVRTINSLPDTSAYIEANGGTNTIKFKDYGGTGTDAGAINTLTEEEIAVATAKGWTVTLV